MAISRTQQKRARKTQKTERVTRLMSRMESQKRIGMNWPSQKTSTLIVAGTLFCADSKHHFSSLSSLRREYHLKAASCLPAMFLVFQKSALRRMLMMMKVERYWLVAILKMRYLAIVKGIQYDGAELEREEDENNSEFALVVGLIEVFLYLGGF